jgi:glycosyltransferase involved in cell wall biosynthesis
MHILIVSQYFWPENFRINDLAEGLVARGHRVSVLTGLPNYPCGRFAQGYSWRGPYRETRQEMNIIRMPLFPRGNGRFGALILNYLSFMVTATLLCFWRCRDRYDAILVFQLSPVTVGVPARLFGWARKIPILFWIQDLWPDSLSATGAVKSPLILRTMDILVHWIYKGCAKILIQSKTFSEPVKARGVPNDRIHYFPNSAESFYHQIPTPLTWSGPALPSGFRIMFAGNLGAAQSFETILSAAEQLKNQPDIQWIIVGDGRVKEWIASEVVRRELQHSVHLMGRHAPESMPEWFAQADAMLVTLRREPIFSLTVPSKIQSYMACAKPIIAALDGEGARIIDVSGSGIAVPAEDPDQLANAVRKMYAMSHAQRMAIGAAGRIYFEQHFSRETLIEQLEGWMKEVTS